MVHFLVRVTAGRLSTLGASLFHGSLIRVNRGAFQAVPARPQADANLFAPLSRQAGTRKLRPSIAPVHGPTSQPPRNITPETPAVSRSKRSCASPDIPSGSGTTTRSADLPDLDRAGHVAEAERLGAVERRHAQDLLARQLGEVLAHETRLGEHVEIGIRGKTVGAQRDAHAAGEEFKQRMPRVSKRMMRAWTVDEGGVGRGSTSKGAGSCHGPATSVRRGRCMNE